MQSYQAIPRQRRRTLGLFVVSLLCLVSFTLLARSNLHLESLLSHRGPHSQSTTLVEQSSSRTISSSVGNDQVGQQSRSPDEVPSTTTRRPSPTRAVPVMRYPFGRASRYVFDQNDLHFTTELRIDKPGGCDVDRGFGVDLVVLVHSHIAHFDRRSAIRDTWGKLAVERGAMLYFVLGSEPNDLHQTALEHEDELYGDLIQAFVPDTTSVLKAVATLVWLFRHCTSVRYVVRLTDTALVHMQRLTDYAETATRIHKSIQGVLTSDWTIPTNVRDPHYVPHDQFPMSIAPNFTFGPNYLFNGDAIKPLYSAAITAKMVPCLEDLFITGLVAEQANIKVLNHRMITNQHILPLDECNFNQQWTSLGYNATQIRNIWSRVYERKCEDT